MLLDVCFYKAVIVLPLESPISQSALCVMILMNLRYKYVRLM